MKVGKCLETSEWTDYVMFCRGVRIVLISREPLKKNVAFLSFKLTAELLLKAYLKDFT